MLMSPALQNVPTAAAWAAALVARLAAEPAGLADGDLDVLRAQAEALARVAVPAGPADPAAPEVVRTPERLRQVAALLAGAPAVAIDLETSGLDPRAGEIVGVGLAAGEGVYYVPCAHRFEDTKALLPDQMPFAAVAEELNLGRLPLVAHNAKFELRWLRQHAGMGPRFVWDTLLAARLLHSDRPADLKEVATRELDVPGWGLPPAELRRIQLLPIDRVARYCARDACYTLQLMKRQKACLV
jgi:DNA polymerase I-like protein with 3'-5' exonuclease and polymerase domains